MSDLLAGRDVRLTCGVLLFGAVTEFLPEVGGVVTSGNFCMLRLGDNYRGALDVLEQMRES